MDLDAEKQKLIDEQMFIQQWLDHPVTRAVLDDNKEQQENAVKIICQESVSSFGSACALLEAKGHLRGLRRFMSTVDEQLEIVKEKLKELNEQKT